MLKTLLLGTAMLFAIPALAQTSTTTSSPTGTTTNDHDPMESADDSGIQATGTPTTGSQVNGGVTTSSPGMRVGQTGTDTNCSQGSSASSAGSANSQGARGDVASACGTSHSNSNAAASTSSTGTGAMGAMSATGSYTGAGGPYQAARNYPPCSRTVTDSCIQIGRHRTRR